MKVLDRSVCRHCGRPIVLLPFWPSDKGSWRHGTNTRDFDPRVVCAGQEPLKVASPARFCACGERVDDTDVAHTNSEGEEVCGRCCDGPECVA